MNSYCYSCHRRATRERKAKDPQRFRTQQRACDRRRRRKRGIPEGVPVILSKPTKRDVVPRLPFANFLRELAEERGSTNKAARAVEMNPRRVSQIIDGYSQLSKPSTRARWEEEVYGRPLKHGNRRKFYAIDWVEFETVDRALMAYGEPWLLDELYPIGDDE